MLHKTSDFVGRFVKQCIDFLYPNVCVGCGSDAGLLCESCTHVFLTAEHDRCVACGAQCVIGNLCRACLPGSGFDALYVLTTYEHPWLQELLHAYKYEGAVDAGHTLAALLGEAAHRRWRLGMDSDRTIVTPIPLAARRQSERGFNQSEILARHVAAATGKEYAGDILVRTKHTEQQATLDRGARHENMRGAFAVADIRPVLGASVLLIDDVYTTGATLRAAADALCECGVAKVIGVTLAHRA